MNIRIALIIQSIGFLVLLLPGIFDIVTPIFSSLEERTISGLPEGLSSHPWIILPVLQYVVITALSVTILIFCHSLTASTLIQHLPTRQKLLIHLLWSLALWVSVIILNTRFFPHSRFANSDLEISSLINPSITILSLLIIFPVIVCITQLIFKIPLKYTFSAALLIALLETTLNNIKDNKELEIETSQPNIFIVGIDSLRPELISEYMPFLNKQLEDSKQFPNSYTPFARTYPAWMSILTGRYPHNNGARFNLADEDQLASDNSYLPATFKLKGYQTIYAADERRFSNLGSKQGFDTIIGPDTGVRDFLLGAFADFPTSNLMLKLPLASYLFPEIYSNRAAHRLYYPEQFSKLLGSAIHNLDKSPIFMAVHFCLPHWPYLFANHEIHDNYTGNASYPQNLRAVDQQIESLFSQLERSKLLENSIIVFLSDHGESWGNAETGLSLEDGSPFHVADFGHGMNILSADSHKVLIAVKASSIKNSPDSSLRSLVDIAPTIYQLTNTPIPQKLDGFSLLTPAKIDRTVFFESGIVMAEANQENPDEEAVAKNGIRHFRVTNDGLLRVKKEAAKQMMQQKQLGVRTLHAGLYYGHYTELDTSLKNWQESLLNANFEQSSFVNIPITSLNTAPPPLMQAFCNAYKNENPNTLKICSKSNPNH